MPRHTKAQAPTGESIPGRIIRVRLDGTNYLTYSPELLCRLTEWHHLRGSCQHGRAETCWRRPCASCGHYWVQDSKRTLQNTLQNPARKIALVPWPKAPDGSGPEDLEREGGVKIENWYSPVASSSGHARKRMGKQHVEERFTHELLEGALQTIGKKKQLRRVRLKSGKSLLDVVQKKKSQQGKDPKGLRFAHFMPGQDDPVEGGRDMAFSGEVLPSDGIWRAGDGSGAGVRLGTEEEKELADLRKQGVLKDVVDGEEGVLTMDSIVRGEEPVYRVRLIQRKKKGGKGKGRTVAVQAEREGSEERASDASSDVVADGVVAARDADQTLELLPQEVIDAMPDHCWAEFFADLEAEGWVPVIEDDLASVAESWVVMESESEESDGKT